MKNLFDLSDDIVVITGGTGTIGKAFAKALLDAGAKVILWGRGQSAGLAESVKEVEEATGGKGRVFSCRVDTSKQEEVQSALECTIDKAGIPTVLINGVGGNRGKSAFVDADIETFEEVVKLNLLGGMVIPTQVFARFWIDNNIQGSIINIASAASYIPLSGVWAYGAAKAGVMNLTMGAAKEFAPHGIRVNGIAPGFFVGHQNKGLLYDDYEKGALSHRGKQIIDHTPYNRFGEENDLFGTVVFLASRKAAGFVTGVTIPVDGGYLIDNI